MASKPLDILKNGLDKFSQKIKVQKEALTLLALYWSLSSSLPNLTWGFAPASLQFLNAGCALPVDLGSNLGHAQFFFRLSGG